MTETPIYRWMAEQPLESVLTLKAVADGYPGSWRCESALPAVLAFWLDRLRDSYQEALTPLASQMALACQHNREGSDARLRVFHWMAALGLEEPRGVWEFIRPSSRLPVLLNRLAGGQPWDEADLTQFIVWMIHAYDLWLEDGKPENARTAPIAKPGVCLWKTNAYGAWDTGCGRSFVFISDTPEQNGFTYCPYCGHLLKQSDEPH